MSNAAIDGGGSIYATGIFAGSANFDPIATSFTLSATGAYTGFVSKMTQPGPLTFAGLAIGTSARYTLRVQGADLQIVDSSNNAILFTKPLEDTTSIVINAAIGVDTTLTIDLGTAAATIPITFNGGAGTNNTLIGPNSVNTWTITNNNAGNINGVITFTGVASLTGGAQSDVFKFSGGSISKKINGGAGSNTLDYSSNLGQSISVNLQTSTASSINGGLASGFSNIAAFVGGTNLDFLTGTNAATAWAINGVYTGTANAFTFSGMEFLNGGTAVDTFKFSSTGRIIQLNGGGGGDWLDYSGFRATEPVTVNFATGAATGINGGAKSSVSNIQNVIGGGGNDTITGNNLSNILVGGPGNDSLMAGNARSMLIGGTGADALVGGNADDLMISGSTSYDVNTAALQAILAEWTSTRDYITRVNNILGIGAGTSSNGSYTLKFGVTVFNDSGSLSGSNRMRGGAGQELFFGLAIEVFDASAKELLVPGYPSPKSVLQGVITKR